ncbi:MAG: EVE domain-containing protein [Candidatus Uhrbacteria bacterium]
MNHWLLKTEPSTYSWDDLVQDKRTSWTGVRNYLARNTLRAMRVGDLAFVYHSGGEKAIKGIAKIVRAAYPDETATEGALRGASGRSSGTDWVAVDIEPVRPFERDLTLGDMKKIPALAEMVLLNNSRLSVQPVTAGEWKSIITGHVLLVS